METRAALEQGGPVTAGAHPGRVREGRARALSALLGLLQWTVGAHCGARLPLTMFDQPQVIFTSHQLLRTNLLITGSG